MTIIVVFSSGPRFPGEPPGASRDHEGGAERAGSPHPAEGLGAEHLPLTHALLDLQEDAHHTAVTPG